MRFYLGIREPLPALNPCMHSPETAALPERLWRPTVRGSVASAARGVCLPDESTAHDRGTANVRHKLRNSGAPAECAYHEND